MILQVWLVPVWLCEKGSVSLMTWYRLLKWFYLQNCCFGDIHHPPKLCSLLILHCHIAFNRDRKILSVKWWCLSNSYTKMKAVYAGTLFTSDGLQTHTHKHTHTHTQTVYFLSYNKSTFHTVHCDGNPFLCKIKKQNKMSEGFHILDFYW